MRGWLRAACRPPFLAGLGCGVALGWTVQVLPDLNWHLVMAPLEGAPLTIRVDAKGDGRFGAPRSGNRRHHGVDLEAPVGTPVRAIRSGVVMEHGTHRGLGRYLELEHAHGLRSRYAHLETVTAAVGRRVRQGQVIATVGKTGNARHPLIKSHLHLEVHKHGLPIDPATLGLTLVSTTTRTSDDDADGGE